MAGETQARRAELYGMLGDLPNRDRPVSARTLTVEERPGYILETLVLDLNGIEDVPAYFVQPKDSSGPFPTLRYNHAHHGEYLIGRNGFLNSRGALEPYADAIARRPPNNLWYRSSRQRQFSIRTRAVRG